LTIFADELSNSGEQGRFLSDWQEVTSREMDWTGLKLMLEGSMT
jgi:hypothetical protein